MKIDAKIKYQEEYLPTKRHRIPRIREVEETVTVELQEFQKKDAALALVVRDYKSFLDQNGMNQFALVDTPFFVVDEVLYTRKKDMSGALDLGPYALDAFIKDVEDYENHCYSYSGKTREDTLQRLHQFVDSHILIEGEVYRASSEPRYLINTFGLGHNHGGTAMFIEYGYNPNISHTNYFNALQRNQALTYADEVAQRRGDTDSVGKFDDINITVYMPEVIRCCPEVEHGNGNSLLNSMECLIQSSNSSMEAGIMVLAETSRNLSKTNPTLSERIEEAATRTQNPNNIKPPTVEKTFP